MAAEVNSRFLQRGFRRLMGLLHAGLGNFEWPSVLILAILPEEAFAEASLLRDVLGLFGVLLLTGGLALRLWGRGFQKSRTFVLDGPYRYVQNPDEVAALLLYIGAYFVLGVIWSWVFAFLLLLLAYFACVSGAYEDKLQQKVGHNFPRYRQRVKRWFPCFYPAVNRSKASFSWAKAVKSEYSTWLWLFGILVVAALRAWSVLPLF